MSAGVVSWREAWRDQGRFLLFLTKRDDFDRFGWKHFFVGLLFTWLVGLARNWDYPDALLFARLGLASVAYIFAMAAAIWIAAILLAMKPRPYLFYLTMVAMTAAPGLVYGIPVEMFLSPFEADRVNMWFLLFVAAYRVSLAVFALRRGAEIPFFYAIAGLFLPILAIITALYATGRAEFVLNVMGGLREEPPEINRMTGEALDTIAVLSWVVSPVVLAIYFVGCVDRSYRRNKAKRAALLEAQEGWGERGDG